jgi:hypothetical protein
MFIGGIEHSANEASETTNHQEQRAVPNGKSWTPPRQTIEFKGKELFDVICLKGIHILSQKSVATIVMAQKKVLKSICAPVEAPLRD